MNIVWFKKDLRTFDHLPLLSALKQGNTIGLFIIEDEWINSPQFSDRHLQFCYDCLKELKIQLKRLNVPLVILQSDTLSAFKELHQKVNIEKVFSHLETGLMWTFKRDQIISEWFKENNIHWIETHQFANYRGLKDRDKWNSFRKKIINRPPYPQAQPQASITVDTSYSLPLEAIKVQRNPLIQSGGRIEGLNLLQSFLEQRAATYSKDMSSPLPATTACSRISPHLSWGTISISEVEAKLQKAKEELTNIPPSLRKNLSQGYRSFEKRLWWHCHFIQKLESDTSIEFHNMNRGFDGMRENDFNHAYFEAWKKGETGFPFIDACMRSLIKTGWLNFRMRAMLVSFATYQLWLHWKPVSLYLSQLFTDFEPGIHYSQIQMQSGVTGINTIRMYSPLKQSLDQDPQGEFILKYCPELKPLKDLNLHQPNENPEMLLLMNNFQLGRDYPEPIVDHVKSFKLARDKVFAWRNRPIVRELAKDVFKRLGSRQNNFFPIQHRQAFGNLDCKNYPADSE